MSRHHSTDKWDWVWLYYCAIVLLNMPDSQFWRTTPRKLSALISKYMQVHGLSENEQEEDNAKAFKQLMQP